MGSVCSLPEVFPALYQGALETVSEDTVGLASEEEGRSGGRFKQKEKAFLLQGQEVNWCGQGSQEVGDTRYAKVVVPRASAHRNSWLPRIFEADSSVIRVVMTRDEGLSPFIKQVMQ